ncbi:TolC family protein [uncultured Proteiniphilum sp.]|uniref:TolC family protein n=1 Tax=uncultured Proteiniphilum sp. TaxID=497637 RepID=UPI00263541E0|nr:TolC family protein [uncultured Proteiniphilum sp.]
MKNNNRQAVLLITGCVVFFGLSSCNMLNPYRSPVVDTAGLYRETASSDTTSIADIPWRNFFSDPYLVSLIDTALFNNADLQIAVSSIRQAEAELKRTRAAYFPNLSVGVTVTHAAASDGNKAFSRNSENVFAGISANWDVDVWGKLNRQSRAQYARFLKSQAYRDMVQSGLIAHMADSYYALLALDEQLAITNETVVLLEKSVATMEALKEAGRQNAAAIEQSRVLLLKTKMNAIDTENSIRQLENTINLLSGKKPGPVVRSRLESQPVPMQLKTGVPVQLLARRPDVKQAELDFRVAFELKNAAQAGFYPSITLSSGSVGYSSSGFSNLFSLEKLVLNVVAGLTQPVFARGQLKVDLALAEEDQLQAMAAFQNTVLNAGKEISDILYTYESVTRKTELREQQIDAAQKSVVYTEELLRADEVDYTAVLTAQQEYLSARLSRISEQLTRLQCTVDLYNALGGGTE